MALFHFEFEEQAVAPYTLPSKDDLLQHFEQYFGFPLLHKSKRLTEEQCRLWWEAKDGERKHETVGQCNPLLLGDKRGSGYYGVVYTPLDPDCSKDCKNQKCVIKKGIDYTKPSILHQINSLKDISPHFQKEWKCGRHFYLLMDEIPEAKNLSELQSSPVDAEILEKSLGLLAKKLKRIQKAGLAHLDLHPGNILFDRNNEPWFIDWDSAIQNASPKSQREDVEKMVGKMGMEANELMLRQCLLADG